MNATQLLLRSGLVAVLFLLHQLPAAAQTLPANYRQTNNIPYVTGGQHRQWLDLYHVPGATNPTPVVVWLHGGGWSSGNEDFPRALALTNHNIAVAAVSYRYTTNRFAPTYPANVPHPAQIQDVKSALRWLRANAAQFNIDPARIGIWGFSSGGHLSALAGTTGHTNLFDVGENLGQSSRVQAVVDMTGPTDLLQVPTTVPGEDYDRLLLGAAAASNPPTLATVNPINFVRADAPPFRIVHGEADPNVNILASELLHTALTNAGVSSTFVRLPGNGHIIPATQDAPAAQWLADRLNSIGATNPPASNTLRAHEPFAAAAGTFLHGQSGGSGFATPWAVLGFDSNANQFRNASAAPLVFGSLQTSGNYVVGGYNNFTSSRRLDVAGAFPDHLVTGSSPAVIGRDGTTLWLSALVRKDSNDDVQLAVSLVNADDISNVNNVRVGMGYYAAPSNNGGQRFWTLLVNNPATDNFTFVRTAIPITNGVPALLVMRIQFGVTDQIDLFVNPPLGGAAPVTPAATRSTTGGANILFRTVGFWSSANQNNAALDELRLGDSFLAVTPTNAPVAAPGTLQFSAATYSVSEGAGSATLTVTRAGGTSGAVGVSHATSNGSATAGSDFTSASGALNWANGDAAIKTFTVGVTDDATVESDETVNLTLSNPTGGATLGVPATATLTIADDDGVVSLVVSNHSFELPAIAPGAFSAVAAPPGWSAYGSGLNFGNRTIGVLHPATTTLYVEPAPHGQNVGVIFLLDNQANQTFFAGIEAGLQQTLTATLQPLRQYTLTVEVGNIGNAVTAPFQFAGFPNYRIDLLAGTTVIASDLNTLLPGEGRFLTSTTTVSIGASHAQAGQPLGIRLVNLNSAPGIEVNWDNVRLTAGPVAAPVLTTNPQSQAVNVGANVTFSAAATGTPAPAFQWQRSGTNLPGATGATLTLNSVQVSDAGNYSVVASNVAGLATSPAATLTVNVPATPPAVTTQPSGAVVVAGSNHTFTVSASGTPPLTYQWLRNSVALPGATSPTLALTNVARTNTGSYVVQITGPGGTTPSQPASLRVLNFPRLQLPQSLPGGAFRLHFNDHDGGALTLGDTANFEVWVSTNLLATNWLRLNLPLTITNGLLTLDDADAATHPRRFYRVLER